MNNPGLRFLFTGMILLLLLPAVAQEEGSEVSHLLPTVIPPSPTAAALGEYGDTQIGYYTGSARVDIPLGSAKSGSIDLPLSLSYHSSGHMVDQAASWVGLGWSLNGAGVISRIMRGKPDESPLGYWVAYDSIQGHNDPNVLFDPSYYTVNSPNPNRAVEFASGTFDLQPDLFVFNFNGRSGKFFIDPATMEVHGMPVNDLRIEFEPGLQYFVITTPDGIKYTFSEKETTTSENLVSIGGNPSPSQVQVFHSSWYLSSITSHDGIDQITFDYHRAVVNQPVSRSETDYLKLNATSVCPDKPKETSISIVQREVCYLKEIHSKRSKILFDALLDREDILLDYRLDKVRVFSNENKTSEIRFHTSYFEAAAHTAGLYTQNIFGLNPSKRLRLDSLSFLGRGTFLSHTYQFEYNPTPIAYMGSYQVDSWGYYNGKPNQGLLPATPHNGTTWPGADKSPNPDFSKAGVLKKVIFPTKGWTEFEYEGHRGEANELIGGIRLAQIRTSDGMYPSRDIIKVLKYTDGVTQAQPLYIYNSNQYALELAPQNGSFIIRADCNYLTRTSAANTPLTYTQGSHVGYPIVTEWHGLHGENGKIEYHYSHGKDPVVQLPPFPPVSSYDFRRGLLLKKETYKWIGGGSNPSFQLLQKEETIYNDYQSTAPQAVLKGLVFSFRKKVPILASTTYNTLNEYYHEPFQYTSQWIYPVETRTTFYDNPAHPVQMQSIISYEGRGHIFPTRTRIKNSDGSWSESRLKYPMDYNPSIMLGESSSLAMGDLVDRHMLIQPIESQSWEVRNGSERLLSSQVTDMDNFASPHDTMMVIRPSAAYLIETESPIPVHQFPESVSNNGYLDLFPVSGLFKKKAAFSYDHRGKPSTQQMVDDVPIAFLWSTDDELPIAKVSNAGLDEIAYTSFEGDDAGQWIIGFQSSQSGCEQTLNTCLNSTTDPVEQDICYEAFTACMQGLTNLSLVSTDKKTGLGAYTFLPSKNIKRENLPAGLYHLSYWRKGGSIQINLSGNSTHRLIDSETDANGWIFESIELDLKASSNDIEISGSTNGLLDELRLLPKDAQMETYCYDSAFRLRTTTDVSNRASHFIYDEMGRLKYVLDQEGNYREGYQYKYRQHPFR
ncbi:MAG: hypothetical protein AAFY71_23020 [Bacteroidota bacterium]